MTTTLKRQRSAVDEATDDGDGEESDGGGMIGSPPRRRSSRILPPTGVNDAGTKGAVGTDGQDRRATGASSSTLTSPQDADEKSTPGFEGADTAPPSSTMMSRAQFVARALRRLTPDEVRERYRSLQFPASPSSRWPPAREAVGRHGCIWLERNMDAVDYSRVGHYQLTDLELLTQCPQNVEMLLRFVDDKDRPVWITDHCFLLKEMSERTLHGHLMTITYTRATKIRGRTARRCLHLFGPPRALEVIDDDDDDGSDEVIDADDDDDRSSSVDGSEGDSILADEDDDFNDGHEGGDVVVVDHEGHVRDGIDALLRFIGMSRNVTRLALGSDHGSYHLIGQDVHVRYPFRGTANGLRDLVGSIRAPIEFALEGFRLAEDHKEAMATAGWDSRVRVQFALMEWVHYSGILVLVEAIRTNHCPANLDLHGMENLPPGQMQVLADAIVGNTCIETFRISAIPLHDVSLSTTVRTLTIALPRNAWIRSLTLPLEWLQQTWSTFWLSASMNRTLKSIILTGASDWVQRDQIQFLAKWLRAHNTTLEHLEFDEPLDDPDHCYGNHIRPVLALNRFRAVADSIRRLPTATGEGCFVHEFLSSSVRTHASFAFVLLSANPDLLVRCLPRRGACE